MFSSALGLFFLIHTILGQDSPCIDYAVNDCAQDSDAEIIAFNTGTQLKCQQHCEIEEECQFYAFHKRASQNVDGHLFREQFSVYLGHCDLRMGPLNQSPPGKCLTPDENSCEVEQYEDCILMGVTLESCLSAPDAVTCEALCKVNQEQGCKFWEWSREKGCCSLHDSAAKDCNIAFGPREGAPGDCGSTEKPPETTTGSTAAGTTIGSTATETTTGTTASQGVCGITCPPNGLQLFADCDNCNQYYECYNGVLSPKICPNCYHFDEDKGYCNQPSEVSCGNRPPEEDCNAATKPGDCPYDNGYLKDMHDCQRYFVCEDGKPTSHSCSNATFTGLYDYHLEMCNSPDKVDCEERPICTGEPLEYKNCQCQGAEKVPDFSCPGVGSFLDPFNCQVHWNCFEWVSPNKRFCADGYYAEERVVHSHRPSTRCGRGDGSVFGGRPTTNIIVQIVTVLV